MPLSWKPRVTDDLIMGFAKDRAPGVGVNTTPTDIITATTAKRDDALRRNENFEANLKQSREQFDKSYGLSKKQLDYTKGQNNIATGISALGLGVAGVGAYQESKRADQRKSMMKDMIAKYQGMGTEQGNMYARLIQLMAAEER